MLRVGSHDGFSAAFHADFQNYGVGFATILKEVNYTADVPLKCEPTLTGQESCSGNYMKSKSYRLAKAICKRKKGA